MNVNNDDDKDYNNDKYNNNSNVSIGNNSNNGYFYYDYHYHCYCNYHHFYNQDPSRLVLDYIPLSLSSLSASSFISLCLHKHFCHAARLAAVGGGNGPAGARRLVLARRRPLPRRGAFVCVLRKPQPQQALPLRPGVHRHLRPAAAGQAGAPVRRLLQRVPGAQGGHGMQVGVGAG